MKNRKSLAEELYRTWQRGERLYQYMHWPDWKHVDYATQDVWRNVARAVKRSKP
jgi:hypothetical protein